MENLPLNVPIALIFGNELDGLSGEQMAQAEAVFKIPMMGFTQSFNVSVACALAVQRLMLAREAQGVPHQPLSAAEEAELRCEWTVKSLPNAERLLAGLRKRSGE